MPKIQHVVPFLSFFSFFFIKSPFFFCRLRVREGSQFKSVEECVWEISGNPTFYIVQSDLNKTSFFTFYETKVVVEGSEEYLNSCDIAKVLG